VGEGVSVFEATLLFVSTGCFCFARMFNVQAIVFGMDAVDSSGRSGHHLLSVIDYGLAFHQY